MPSLHALFAARALRASAHPASFVSPLSALDPARKQNEEDEVRRMSLIAQLIIDQRCHPTKLLH